MNFKEKLNLIVNKNNSLLCIGLDPELDKLPLNLIKKKNAYFQFNKAIIDSTYDCVSSFKPNIAFYEAQGIEGLQQLKLTMEYLQKNYPRIPVILDAKRGDIGNTAKMYATSAYNYWQADSVTVYPYLGLDSVKPFLEYKDKLTIFLIKTSNPDSKMFQDMNVNKSVFFLELANKIAKWNYDNIGIFVGATYPEELKKIRQLFPDSIFLSAGLGAQGGDVEKAVKAGIDKNKQGIMFNASRSILYASNKQDFAEKARVEAIKIRDEINKHRN